MPSVPEPWVQSAVENKTGHGTHTPVISVEAAGLEAGGQPKPQFDMSLGSCL